MNSLPPQIHISSTWAEFTDDLRKAGLTFRFRYNAKTHGIEGISYLGTTEGSLPGLFVPCRVLKHGSGNNMRPQRSHRRADAKHEKEDDLKSFGLFGHPLE